MKMKPSTILLLVLLVLILADGIYNLRANQTHIYINTSNK